MDWLHYLYYVKLARAKATGTDDMLKRLLGFIIDCIISIVVLVVVWIIINIIFRGKELLSVLIALLVAIISLLILQKRRRKRREESESFVSRPRNTIRHESVSSHNRPNYHATSRAVNHTEQKPHRYTIITNITHTGTNNYTVWGDIYEGEKIVRRNTHLGGTIRNGELKGWGQDFFVIVDDKGQVWSFDAKGKLIGSLKYNPDTWVFGNVGGPGFTLRAKASQ